MRRRLGILSIGLALALLAPTATLASGGPSAASERARILAYWTPERIAHAIPRDYVRDDSGRLVPARKPGGGGSGAVTGASWTAGGVIERRSGRVVFHSGQYDWICSGSVVSDGSTANGYSIVLTAGHCVYDGTDGWSTNFMFIPDFDAAPTYTCGDTLYGCWTATRLGANAAFVNGGGFGNDTVGVDYGFARVGPGGKSGSGELDAVVGSYGLKTSATSFTDTQWAFGYPAQGRYKGRDLTYCTGTTSADPYGAPTWGMACDMNGGSSGGPWLWGTSDPATDTAKLASSVNSYGYQGRAVMYGPRFDADTAIVRGDVGDGTATAGVTILH